MPGSSSAPVIVIDAPPPVDPIEGVTERIVGAGFLGSGCDGAVGPRPQPATPQTVRKLAVNNPAQ
jgi:hypothetical protein